MSRISRNIVWVLFSWYVCTAQGQPVVGPFVALWDCNRVAGQMIAQGYDVRMFCVYR